MEILLKGIFEFSINRRKYTNNINEFLTMSNLANLSICTWQLENIIKDLLLDINRYFFEAWYTINILYKPKNKFLECDLNMNEESNSTSIDKNFNQLEESDNFKMGNFDKNNASLIKFINHLISIDNFREFPKNNIGKIFSNFS
jgi:hypothetical protein